jgi:hypothetical protein
MKIIDVPDDRLVFNIIADYYNFDEAVGDITYEFEDLIKVPLDIKNLAEEVQSIISEHGLHYWRYSEKLLQRGYKSISLVKVPDSVGDWRRATLGSEKLSLHDVYDGNSDTAKYQSPEILNKLGGKLKGSYFDTYSFRQLTPAGEATAKYLDYKCSPIRSRISAIEGQVLSTTDFRFGWHRDESVFENTRFNIPITTTPEYRLQVENEKTEPDAFSDTMSDYHLDLGYGYSWDTAKPHRVYSRAVNNTDRVNIVLGFSPWFDYDAVEDSWKPNQFFGKKHPLKMLVDGDVLTQRIQNV